MEGNDLTGLELKIQKLIDGYTSLREKYEILLTEKDKLETSNLELMETLDKKNQEINEVKLSMSQKDTLLDQVRREKEEIQTKLNGYETSTKDAASKIDDILSKFNQI